MNPVDLVDYTNKKNKIPSHHLVHKSSKESEAKTWKILGAYILDSMAISSLSSGLFFLLKIYFATFMVGDALTLAFNRIPFADLSMSLMPLLLTSYYFFSYFFNDGQTWGKSVFKNRIQIPELNLRSCLIWALFSTTVTMSFGLSYFVLYPWMQKRGFGKLKQHDHLYEYLMLERTLSPVNLVHLSQKSLAAQTQENDENDYLKVA
jgi:hypothetical protein